MITAKDVESIYEVPLFFHQEGLDDKIVQLLNIWTRAPRLEKWEEIVSAIKNPRGEVDIAIVGKYVHLKDSYKSLTEALVHGGIANRCRVNLHYVDSEAVEKEGVERFLQEAQGILVPGGFGDRGIEGKIKAVNYARTMRVPFLGICLGMQLAIVEFARHVCGLEGANSSEFNASTPHPVIALLAEQQGVAEKGGTMRLGAYPAALLEGSLAHQAYQTLQISERHRHRYEVNNQYRQILGAKGMVFSGLSPDGKVGGNFGAAGPSLVSGLSVPPGAEIATPGAPSAVPGVYSGRFSGETEEAEKELMPGDCSLAGERSSRGARDHRGPKALRPHCRPLRDRIGSALPGDGRISRGLDPVPGNPLYLQILLR